LALAASSEVIFHLGALAVKQLIIDECREFWLNLATLEHGIDQVLERKTFQVLSHQLTPTVETRANGSNIAVEGFADFLVGLAFDIGQNHCLSEFDW
jgi:hypothetical protein